MADVRISDLTPAGQALLTQLLEVDDTVNSESISIQQLVDLLNTGQVPGIQDTYANIAARDLDQANVPDDNIVEVTDASDDVLVNSGRAWYGRNTAGSPDWILLFGEDLAGSGGAATEENEKYYVSPDIGTVITAKYTTPVQLTPKFFNGVTALQYRTKLDDGVDTFTDRADLSALNTYLAGLADDVDVEVEMTANPTKLTVVKINVDRS